MEEKVNEITEAKNKIHIDLKYYTADTYYTVLEADLADVQSDLKDARTKINDLYSLTASAPSSYRSDWVHFYTPEGTELIGCKVLSVICKILAVTPKHIDMEKFESERYSKSKIGY
jgi:hypothetical protein